MQPEDHPPAAPDIELSVVVPVYQEESALPLFLARIRPVLDRITSKYEILFSMDPGNDRTQEVIEAEIAKDSRIRLLIMTRRWGQDACMSAGLDACLGQACVIIDVDLQDPPELMEDMHRKWREGFEVVYAERRSRKGDPLPRRVVAYLGYWLINRISEIKIPRNIGDFRLVDRKVIEGLRGLKETHGFLRGLVPYVGYRQTSLLYDRAERQSGRSKYSAMVGSLRHGLNGIVAFSSKPLTLVTAMGFITAGISALLTFTYIGAKIVLGRDLTTGLSPLILLVTFLGGVQLISLGIIGEYIGRIYEEVRQRPKYMIARKINFPVDRGSCSV
jgi:polyisoprenyl-phosphate glycosyltransferase